MSVEVICVCRLERLVRVLRRKLTTFAVKLNYHDDDDDDDDDELIDSHAPPTDANYVTGSSTTKA